MTTLARTAVLPFDHLSAELIAFPLSSEIALRQVVTRLDPAMNVERRTAELWRAAERSLVTSAPGITLDELTALRDECWFSPRDTNGAPVVVPLHHHLEGITRRHLAMLGDGPSDSEPPWEVGPLAPRAGPARARRAWMWLTFALPEDLLLTTCCADGSIPEPQLISAPVSDLLIRGFAETHLHAGASLDFPTIWAVLMDRLASPDLAADALAAPGAVLDEGRGLVRALLHAAVGRVVLAHFLGWAPAGCTFSEFLYGPFRQEFAGAGLVNFHLLSRALRGLREGLRIDTDFPQLRGAYVELAGRAGSSRDLDDLARIDPVAQVLPGGRGTAEQRLMVGMTNYFERLAAARTSDLFAEEVFWQAVRVRVITYRHVTQRPLTPGLPWFIRFYERMRKTRGSVPTLAIVEAATVTSGIRDGLHSLEMRTSPDSESAAMQTWASAMQEQAKSCVPAGTEIGMVYHFLKTRGGEIAPGISGVRGAGAHADPKLAANVGRCRFSRYYDDQLKCATTLANLLYRFPRSQYLVRGLDVCADELAVPTWVFQPLLDYVRTAAAAGGRVLQQRSGRQPPRLRTTVHAGEDFAHLLTGLRNVHEAIEVLGMREGDRIGHGMALGIDPAAWARRIGRVAMPLQDRVFDMAWEWNWWTRRGGGSESGRLAFLAHSTAELARVWFDDDIDVQAIQRLRSELADLDALALAEFPGPTPAGVPASPILEAYLRSPAVFQRGMQTVTVNPAGEVDATARIAASLRAEVSRRAIAIELNPTSNLLVGDLSDLANHPLWRLAPPRPNPDLPPLSVTVGSDDPVVFNCRLPLEYQLLYDTLILADLTDMEAMEWLDRVRRTGLERRFTIPADEDVLENLFKGGLTGSPPPPRIAAR